MHPAFREVVIRRIALFVALLLVVGGEVRAQSPEHQACEQGDAEACWVIGDRHYEAGQEHDDPEEIALALTYLEKACDLGKGLACNSAGYVHDAGLGGVREDHVLAQKFYRKACDAGNETGCENSALMRAYGAIYPPDEEPDKLDLSKCERGNPRSCYAAAVALLGREPLDEFAEKAATYLEKACRGGHGQACVELAYLHKEGLGVAYDLALVQMYREKACAAGNFVGCHCLAWDHMKGKDGAPEDEKQSQMYFRKACDLGWSNACDMIKEPIEP